MFRSWPVWINERTPVVGVLHGCYNLTMDLETLRASLLALSMTSEETPFGPEALVYKVCGKMFALIAWQESPLRITLKCDPVEALALRDQYPAILPGYYMNKRHWNTVYLDGSIEPVFLEKMVQDSYNLVVRGLPKTMRDELAGCIGN